jgi:hypothetical protein
MKKRLFFFITLQLILSVAFCQCDNTLKPSDNPQVAYKTRVNRCEGTYTAKVAAPSLDVVGFTKGVFNYKLDKAEVITIENTFNSNIYIRASAIPLNTYYRMDAALEKNTIFKWMVKDVLFNLNIPSNSLGIYGWKGNEKEKIFVPVKPVSSSYKPDKKYYLVIRTSANVLEVKYRYTSGANLSSYESVDGKSRAGQPIVIVLPENFNGAYTIEVAAMLESKSEWVKNQYQISIE